MNAYRKIIRAARLGKALRLSAEDVLIVAQNEGVIARATHEAQEMCRRTYHRKQRNGKCACSMT